MNGLADTRGVQVLFGGSGTTIRGNRLGVLPAGGGAPRNGVHVDVGSATGVRIRDNLFAGAWTGVFIGYVGTTSSADVYGDAVGPTRAGAEVMFSLSAPAEVTVTVLNLAGRPVAAVAQDRAAGAGLQRLTWTGRTLGGTKAPAGRYLVRVTARQAGGGQATGLCAATLP